MPLPLPPTPLPAYDSPPSTAVLPLLSQCQTPRTADQIHARLVTTGLLSNHHLVLSLCASPQPPLHRLARRLLASSSYSTIADPFLWNALIKSSSHGRDPDEAAVTFAFMITCGVAPDRFSFSLALKGCSRAGMLEEGLQLHGLLVKGVVAVDVFLHNCLVGFYCRCGLVEAARILFDRMSDKDSVSWNSMIDGYVKMGMIVAARELFDRMPGGLRNLVTWNSMISGYSHLGSSDGICAARELFDIMPERNLVTWNSLIDAYVKCGYLDYALDLFECMPERDVVAWGNMIFGFVEVGSVDAARCLFDAMPDKDVIAWNIMMSGYAKNGRFTDALGLLHEMQETCYFSPDATTLAIALSAIAELGCVHEGMLVHQYITRNQLPLDGKLGVALIDMYAKCGQLEKALWLFEVSEQRTVDHWNAMIGGLAIHGLGCMALDLFSEMVRLSVKPDDITFIGLLSACSHSGLVEEGLSCFEIMRRHYCIVPKVQHYGCMVDILGRGGRLEEARKLVEDMPMEPNDVILRSLLGACRNQGNIDVGKQVAKHLIVMGSCSSSSYVLLSNIYAGVGMWKEARKVRATMKENDITKVPGCSWIELDGVVHEFVVGDRSHPQAREIYKLLDDMWGHRLSSSRVFLPERLSSI